MQRFYILFPLFIFVFFSCGQKSKTGNQQETQYAAPSTNSAVNPLITLLDTCAPPVVMVVPQKGVNQYTLRIQNGNSDVLLPSLIVDSLAEGEAVGQLFLKNYNTEQGLALSSIACSYIDRMGNLWFGTYGGGVSRYDGKSFTNITVTNGLANNIVRSIIQDRHGNMWFGTNGHGVSKYDGKSFKTFNTENGLLHNVVKSIVEDRMGNLWLGTDGGVSKYSPSENEKGENCFTNYTTVQGLISNQIHKIIVDKNGDLWFASKHGVSRGRSVMTEKGNEFTFTNFTTAHGLINNVVNSVLEDSNGDIWFGTDFGISRLSQKVGTEVGSFYNFTFDKGFTGVVLEVAADKKGNVWFGTGKEVYRYNPSGEQKLDKSSLTHFNADNGFPDHIVYSIIQDKTGSLWFGTYGGGVSKFDGMSVVGFTKTRGLLANKVWDIAEDNEGDLWFLTSSSLHVYNERAFVLVRSIGGRCVMKDKHGDMWIGTGNGVARYNGKTYTYYTVAQGLAPTSVLSIFEDSKGNIWLGTYDGGLSKFDGKSFANYNTTNGLTSNAIKCIAEDKNGDIWIGTNGGGVSKFDGKVFTNYSIEQGLLSGIIYSITKDRSGNLWFGTAGGGLSRYNGKSFNNYTKTQGLADDVVYAIVEDTRNNILWCGTNAGLSGLKLNSFLGEEGSVQFENFNTSTGYAIKDVNTGALFVDSKGVLWVGTGDKLVKFDYKEVNRDFNPPYVFIQGIRVQEQKISWYNLKIGQSEQIDKTDSLAMINEEAISFGHLLTDDQRRSMQRQFSDIKFDSIGLFYPVPAKLVLPYKNNSITFDFVALETNRPQLVGYQYYLEGYDKDWNPVTDKTFATFGNIQEGNYTFKLKAQSPDGIWSQPLSYKFTVLPPWYRTWWMYLIYGAVFIATGVLFFRWRTASLRREKENLERTVEERTAQVVEQKDLIEEKQKEILDSINYAKRIQYTLLANDKLLRQKLSEYFVLFQPKDIVSGDFYWAASAVNSERFYLAICDSTGHGVPGAFMSLLNSSFLNEAVTEKNISKPNEILDYVRQRLIESISADGGQDGMDGILLCIENGVFTYAAANNAPVIVRENTTTYLPTDKMPVGKGLRDEPFTLYSMDIRKGDMLYFYTDGYADQFGGPKGKKFMYKQLNKLLMSIHTDPVDRQKQVLESTLANWKGNLEQVDDVCIIGIKI